MDRSQLDFRKQHVPERERSFAHAGGLALTVAGPLSFAKEAEPVAPRLVTHGSLGYGGGRPTSMGRPTGQPGLQDASARPFPEEEQEGSSHVSQHTILPRVILHRHSFRSDQSSNPCVCVFVVTFAAKFVFDVRHPAARYDFVFCESLRDRSVVCEDRCTYHVGDGVRLPVAFACGERASVAITFAPSVPPPTCYCRCLFVASKSKKELLRIGHTTFIFLCPFSSRGVVSVLQLERDDAVKVASSSSHGGGFGEINSASDNLPSEGVAIAEWKSLSQHRRCNSAPNMLTAGESCSSSSAAGSRAVSNWRNKSGFSSGAPAPGLRDHAIPEGRRFEVKPGSLFRRCDFFASEQCYKILVPRLGWRPAVLG